MDTDFIQWIVLALIQGITEYLPISSSAHLILVTDVMGWQDQGLVMNIAAHGGSLIAVMWYFRTELVKLFAGKNWSLFYQLALASIPLALVGYLCADFIENKLHSPMVIAVASVVFGLLLYVADKIGKKTQVANNKIETTLKTKHALLIGLSQIFALIPGASRSGVTMSAAMAQGFSRTKAAKFSFLLAIPALLMTTAYGFLKILKQPEDYNITGVLVVISVSCLASLVSIKVFLKIIENIPISIFVWYRIILAMLIVWLFK